MFKFVVRTKDDYFLEIWFDAQSYTWRLTMIVSPDGIENHSYEYRTTLREYATNKWESEHDMVVYEINKQADALFNHKWFNSPTL